MMSIGHVSEYVYKVCRVEDGRLGGDGFVSLESAEQSSYNKHASSGLQMTYRSLIFLTDGFLMRSAT
jgi:hypothetical protein